MRLKVPTRGLINGRPREAFTFIRRPAIISLGVTAGCLKKSFPIGSDDAQRIDLVVVFSVRECGELIKEGIQAWHVLGNADQPVIESGERVIEVLLFSCRARRLI